MSIDILKANELEQDRRQLLDEIADENDPHWSEQFKPGSFGCHELMDRTVLVSDLLQQHVLKHPACVLNAEWYALADQAASALCELYQQIGAAHLGDNHETNGAS